MNQIAALQDLSVVHRICFAARSLPIGTPNYWKIISSFCVIGKNDYHVSPEEAKIFIENLQFLNPSVFDCDEELTKSLIKMPKTDPSKPERIGVVLLSPKENCLHCNSELYVRPDRNVMHGNHL